eukprot:Gb_09889 [translate_table: standard]
MLLLHEDVIVKEEKEEALAATHHKCSHNPLRDCRMYFFDRKWIEICMHYLRSPPTDQDYDGMALVKLYATLSLLIFYLLCIGLALSCILHHFAFVGRKEKKELCQEIYRENRCVYLWSSTGGVINWRRPVEPEFGEYENIIDWAHARYILTAIV